jgi:serine/threonine protein kinase/WD40 repeat protein
MNPEAQKVRDVFVAAVKLPPDRWEAFLKEACAGDDELRRQVSDLLREHQQAGNFLDQPAAHVRATGDYDPAANGVASAAVPEGTGTTIGPFKLLELIGEGGMGAVWMAEQREPVQRKVALKIIKAGMDSKQVVARFEAERQALALMDHPHIAKVFDGGTTDGGRPYFVMELVKGVPITRYCDEHRLTPRERLELFVPVCQAIQHAHTKGIIHRDVKPGNVLVAPYDGVPVPKVIDFGVAKATGQRLTERTLFTGFGAVVGTLEYMSPEQAELNNQDIDTRSDIYSLGVLLYELLTGTTPLRRKRLKQAAFTELLRLIREEEPPRPSTRLSESKDTLSSISAQRNTEPAKLARLVRGELDWIVMKALEKDRCRRYDTANSLALDVQHYLADEPVQACPPTVGYRLRKLARRHKAPMAAASLVLLALVAGIIGTTWGLVRADKALSELQDQQARTQAAERDKTLQLARTQAAERDKTLQLAQARWNEAQNCRMARQPGQRYHSLEALAEAVRHLRSLDQLDTHRLGLRNDAIASLTLWDVRPVKHLARVPSLPAPWLDPLGQHYASADGPNLVSWRLRADDQVVRSWHWEGLPCVSLVVSPDGRYVAAFCLDRHQSEKNVCRVWDSVTGSLVLQRPVSSWDHAFRPGGKALALLQADGSLALCDVGTGRDLPRVPTGPGLAALRFSPTGKYLAVSSHVHADVEVWDLTTAKVARRLPGEAYRGGSLAWSPDGSLLAIGSRDSNIYVCTFPGGNIQTILRGHEGVVTGVEYHPSGQLLASSSHDDTTRLWFFPSGGELVLPGEQLQGFSGDGRRLATWSRRRTGTTEWDVANPGDCLHYLAHGQFPIRQEGVAFAPVALAPAGRLLAFTSQDGVQLWDSAAGRLVGRLPSGDGYALAFHPQQRCLFTTGNGGLVRWPIVTEGDGQALRVGPATVVRPTSANSQSLRIDVAGKGDWLLLGAGDGGLDLVPLAEPGAARRLGTHEGLNCVALSRDSRWAVSVGHTGDPIAGEDVIRIWDVARGTVVLSFPLPVGQYPGAAFSPDGRWLVTGVRSEYCFREVGSWEVRVRLPREPRSIHCRIAFSGDGQLLALGQGYNRIDLRDAATLRHLATLEMPGRANLTGLSLSSDGTRLAAAMNWNEIALWDLRRLRRELAALDLDWEMPTYPSAAHAGEPVQALTVEIQSGANKK